MGEIISAHREFIIRETSAEVTKYRADRVLTKQWSPNNAMGMQRKMRAESI